MRRGALRAAEHVASRRVHLSVLVSDGSPLFLRSHGAGDGGGVWVWRAFEEEGVAGAGLPAEATFRP